MFAKPLYELLNQISSTTCPEATYNTILTLLLKEYINEILLKDYADDYNFTEIEINQISNLISYHLAFDIQANSREYIDQFIQDYEDMKLSDQYK